MAQPEGFVEPYIETATTCTLCGTLHDWKDLRLIVNQRERVLILCPPCLENTERGNHGHHPR